MVTTLVFYLNGMILFAPTALFPQNEKKSKFADPLTMR